MNCPCIERERGLGAVHSFSPSIIYPRHPRDREHGTTGTPWPPSLRTIGPTPCHNRTSRRRKWPRNRSANRIRASHGPNDNRPLQARRSRSTSTRPRPHRWNPKRSGSRMDRPCTPCCNSSRCRNRECCRVYRRPLFAERKPGSSPYTHPAPRRRRSCPRSRRNRIYPARTSTRSRSRRRNQAPRSA